MTAVGFSVATEKQEKCCSECRQNSVRMVDTFLSYYASYPLAARPSVIPHLMLVQPPRLEFVSSYCNENSTCHSFGCSVAPDEVMLSSRNRLSRSRRQHLTEAVSQRR